MRKIQKRTAERLYNEGKTILLVPCKMRLNSPWTYIHRAKNTSGDTFEKVVNNFGYYNCCYETGYYPAYYVED